MSIKSDATVEWNCTVALEWLRNEIGEEIPHKRILVRTWGAGYLCHWEDSHCSFAVKYIPDANGSLTLLGMGSADSICDYGMQTAALEKAIVILEKRGEIVQIETPQQYDGGAVFYALA